MFRFFFRKNFYDGCDNLLSVLITNLVFSLMIVCILFINSLVVFPIAFFFFSIVIAGVTGMTNNWVNINGNSIKTFFETIKAKALHILLFYLISVLAFFGLTVALPILHNMRTIFSAFAIVIIVWMSFLWILYSQIFFPLAIYLTNDNPFKVLRKCFYIVSDNVKFSILLLILNISEILLSCVTAFLIPGFVWLSINSNNFVFFVMKKYDWMQEHEVTFSKQVKGYDFLQQTINSYKDRSIKKLLFPWKEYQDL